MRRTSTRQQMLTFALFVALLIGNLVAWPLVSDQQLRLAEVQAGSRECRRSVTQCDHAVLTCLNWQARVETELEALNYKECGQ